MLEALLTVAATAILAFVAWLTVKVLDMERKLVEMESRIAAREKDCEHHHQWMDSIDEKLDKIIVQTAVDRAVSEAERHQG